MITDLDNISEWRYYLTHMVQQYYAIGLLLGLVTLTLIYYETVHGKKARLKSVPGLWDLPLVGDVFHLPGDAEGLYKFFRELAIKWREKGDTILKVSFGPLVAINLLDADDAEKILSDVEYVKKSVDYDFVQSWMGTGLITSTGKKWHSRRKLLTPSFHFGILTDALEIINEHALEFRDAMLSKLSGGDDPFDIFPYLKRCTLDTICEAALGVKLHAIHDEDSPFVRATLTAKKAVEYRMRSPWYWPDFIFYNLKIGKDQREAVNYMHDFAMKVIDQRSQLHFDENRNDPCYQKKKQVFIDTLLDCRSVSSQSGPGSVVTNEDIREEVDTFMFAGHDTVSCGLGYTIHLLASHPDAQQRCQKELDEAVTAGSDITMAQLSKLSYLEACIKESLRMYPPVPFSGRQLPKDTHLGGHLIPAGTTVIVFPAAYHYDPKHYAEPEKFKPDRWIDGSMAGRHPYAYVPFSAGPRNCIGQRYAMMELKVIVATLLRNFTMSTTQTPDEMRPSAVLVLEPEGGIWVRLKPR